MEQAKEALEAAQKKLEDVQKPNFADSNETFSKLYIAFKNSLQKANDNHFTRRILKEMGEGGDDDSETQSQSSSGSKKKPSKEVIAEKLKTTLKEISRPSQVGITVQKEVLLKAHALKAK